MSNFTAVRDHALFAKDMQSMLSGDLPVLTFNTENTFELLDSNSSIVGVLDDSSKFDFNNYCIPHQSSDGGITMDTADEDAIASAIVTAMTSSMSTNTATLTTAAAAAAAVGQQQRPESTFVAQALLAGVQLSENSKAAASTTPTTTMTTTTTTTTFARQYAELAKNLEHSIGNFEDMLTPNYPESSLDSSTKPECGPSICSNGEVLYNDLHLSSCDDSEDDNDVGIDSVVVSENDTSVVEKTNGDEPDAEITTDDGDVSSDDGDVDDVEKFTGNVSATAQEPNTDDGGGGGSCDSDTDADSDYVADDCTTTPAVIQDESSSDENASDESNDDDDDDDDDDDLKNRKILIRKQVRAVKRQLNCAKRKREHRVRRKSSGSSSSSSCSIITTTETNGSTLVLPNVWTMPAACKKPKYTHISEDQTRPILRGSGKRINNIISSKLQASALGSSAVTESAADEIATDTVAAAAAAAAADATTVASVTTLTASISRAGTSMPDKFDSGDETESDVEGLTQPGETLTSDDGGGDDDDDDDGRPSPFAQVVQKNQYAIRSRSVLHMPNTVNMAFACSDDDDVDEDDDDDGDDGTDVSDGDYKRRDPKSVNEILHNAGAKSAAKLPRYCCTVRSENLQMTDVELNIDDLFINPQHSVDPDEDWPKRKKLNVKKDVEFACWTQSKYAKHLKTNGGTVFGLSEYKNYELPANDPVRFDAGTEYVSLYSVIDKYYKPYLHSVRFAPSDLGQSLKLYTANCLSAEPFTSTVVNSPTDIATYHLRYGYIPDKFILELGILLDKMMVTRKQASYDFLEGEIELFMLAYWQLTVADLQWNFPQRKQTVNKQLFARLFDSLVYDVRDNFRHPKKLISAKRKPMNAEVMGKFKSYFMVVRRTAKFDKDPHYIGNEALFLIKQAISVIMTHTRDSRRSDWLMFFKTMNIQHLELPYTYNRLLKTRDAYIEQFYRRMEPIMLGEAKPERSVFLNGLHGERFVATKIKHPAVFTQEDVQCLLPMIFNEKQHVPLYLCVKLDNFFMLVIHWFVKLTSKNQIFDVEKLNVTRTNISLTEQHCATFFHAFMNPRHFTYYAVHILEFAYSKNIITKFGKAITCEFSHQLKNLDVKVLPDSQVLGTLLLLAHSLLNTQWAPVILRENDPITLTRCVAALMDELVTFENYLLNYFNGFSEDQPEWLGGSSNDPSYVEHMDSFLGTSIAPTFYQNRAVAELNGRRDADNCSNSDTDREDSVPTKRARATTVSAGAELLIYSHKQDYSELRTPSDESSDFCDSDSEVETYVTKRTRRLKTSRLVRECRQLENDFNLPLLNVNRLWSKNPGIFRKIKVRSQDCLRFYAKRAMEKDVNEDCDDDGDDDDVGGGDDNDNGAVENNTVASVTAAKRGRAGKRDDDDAKVAVIAAINVDNENASETTVAGGDVDVAAAAVVDGSNMTLPPTAVCSLKDVLANRRFEKERTGADKLRKLFTLDTDEQFKTIDGVQTLGLIPNAKMERGSRSFVCTLCDQNVRSTNNIRVSDEVCVCCCLDCVQRIHRLLDKKEFTLKTMQEIITMRVERRYRAPLMFVSDKRRLVDNIDGPMLKLGEMYPYTYNKFADNYGRRLPQSARFFEQMSKDLNWDNGFTSKAAKRKPRARKSTATGAPGSTPAKRSKKNAVAKPSSSTIVRSRSVVSSDDSTTTDGD